MIKPFYKGKKLQTGPYLGQITSGKRVGTQNRKCPSRDMQKNSKSQNNS